MINNNDKNHDNISLSNDNNPNNPKIIKIAL